MRLAPAEAKAVKFVLLIVALATLARFIRRPEPIKLDAAPAVKASTMASSAQQRATRGPLDPNRATLLELERLPGIGEVTAKRIVAARPIKDLNALAKVIGRKKAQQLAPLLTLRGEIEGAATRDSASGLQQRKPGSDRSDRASQRSTERSREPIDLNRATLPELERISGIGPALARRLILKRELLGRFNDWSQVDAIPGIGPALLKKLKESCTL